MVYARTNGRKTDYGYTISSPGEPKKQLIDLIEPTFKRDEVLYLACNAERDVFSSEEHKNIIYRPVKKLLKYWFVYLLDNFYIRCGSKLFRYYDGN